MRAASAVCAAKTADRAADRTAARWMHVDHWRTRILIAVSAWCARRAKTVRVRRLNVQQRKHGAWLYGLS